LLVLYELIRKNEKKWVRSQMLRPDPEDTLWRWFQ